MIYLDNAATTLIKPPAVRHAVAYAYARCGSAGRGGHKAAMEAADVIYRCREYAAGLFHVGNPENIVFTSNATHALNIAIHSAAVPEGSIVISGLEHNAVMRPLKMLEKKLSIRITQANTPLYEPERAIDSFEKTITKDTSCVICTHVSNVFGYIMPIEQIDRICCERDVPLIIDASQSAGVLPIDFDGYKSKACVCMPGHKGLYGPQGTGILICPEGAKTAPLMQGGTGSNSALMEMPDFLPDRLEAGTHNTPGIAGLAEGIRFVQKTGLQSIRGHGFSLCRYAADRLREIKGVKVIFNDDESRQGGTFSFLNDRLPPEETAFALGEMNIAVRAGLQCAPQAHRTAGTYPAGTVRISVSFFNEKKDMDALIKAVKKLIR